MTLQEAKQIVTTANIKQMTPECLKRYKKALQLLAASALGVPQG